MGIMATILANVRGATVRSLADGSDDQPDMNSRGEMIVAPGLPPLAQLASLGSSWWFMTATATAPVTAIPTTAGLIALWNGESTGKCYVIDSLFVLQVAATAAVQSVGLLVNISTQDVLTALANTIIPRPMRAGRVYNGKARIAVGVTLDATNGVAANWQPAGSTASSSNTTQVGTITEYNVNGGIIIPPNGQLALSVLAGAATASSIQIGGRFHEVSMPVPVS